MPDSLLQLLDMPPAWLALLFQHVASGPRGLANAAALTQTCKLLQSLSEGPVVLYRNLGLAAAISSCDHPVWHWLARRFGRVAGLSLKLCLGTLDADATENADQLPDWMQPLQTLSGTPGVQLHVEWVGSIDDLDHPFIDQWLKQHGKLISHLTVQVHVSEDRLELKDFSEAAASCKSIDLEIRHSSTQTVDLADLHPVSGSLKRLICKPGGFMELGTLRGASAFNSMSQLVALDLACEDLLSEEPWGMLAILTSLQQLRLTVRASGDPSPLSALTRLSSLHLYSLGIGPGGQVLFSFSSLQPLSTLQQLEQLHLGHRACAATSLQGLAGLSSLKLLNLDAPFGPGIKSLEGISSGLSEVVLGCARGLPNLDGIEGCASLEQLSLYTCGVSSLQPLMGLSKLKQLFLAKCCLTSLEGLNSTSLESLCLTSCTALTQPSGYEHLSSLKTLEVVDCGVTSLQALSQLGEGLQELTVFGCKRVQEEVLELPHVQPTAMVLVVDSNVKEVVLAGGLRRAVPHSRQRA
jgi:hypothetical protein